MFPEISRRCFSCGASIRAGARFCPQCGQTLGARTEQPTRKDDYGTFRAASGRAHGSAQGGKPETPSSVQTPARELAEALKAREGEPRGASKKENEDEGGERASVSARVRDVRETLRPRVEKMRDEALVALEESPDDSGLRFILMAVGLFLMFLVFLFLSLKVLG